MKIIMITHERGLAVCYASRMIFLGDGKSVGDQSHVASATGGQPRGGTI
jgi:energy-coupling factor transporter ATP-binding protein EcfA2